ncbi:calcium/sodium antiporter [Thiocapsa imhoffii]|uniref:Calcium/sodium antiporter n=1 Tax=Thiocapsa imhoffii TaxID=382777 RepID=A0A9X0WEL9_9GAMM|nr:calcium/sodium antiporter [Thiocapsa imhoffii]MBK1643121.1 calcium/sodium antiporter [Thiocapsa imhoffii]
MVLASFSIFFGLVLLLWSADRFVEGAAATARHLGMPPLLIGMVVVGFGTSAPEMVVSALAAWQGNPGLALGNAYGSNITNIALILGVTAIISPIAVQSGVLRKELPILAGVTGLAFVLLWDGQVSDSDAWIFLGVFALLMAWTIYEGLRQRSDSLAGEITQELDAQAMPLPRALGWLGVGLVVLIISSRILVWGAVEIAVALGVSDLIIGLTIVAIGTSLPELAASVIAARKGEHDLAIGNIIGSNLFNTLAVVGIAGIIAPFAVPPEVLSRDMSVMGLLTLSLFVLGYGVRGPGRINRLEGSLLLGCFVLYTSYLIWTTFAV